MIKNWLHHKWLKETMTMSELLEKYRQEVLLVSHLAIGTRNGYTSAIRCMHKMEISTTRVKDITHVCQSGKEIELLCLQQYLTA